jgi:hypothetical protein
MARRWESPSSTTPPIRGIRCAYGLFAANPFGLAVFTGDKSQTKETVLEPGKSLRYRYRLIVHPGDAESADIAGLWRKYSAGK